MILRKQQGSGVIRECGTFGELEVSPRTGEKMRGEHTNREPPHPGGNGEPLMNFKDFKKGGMLSNS